VIGEKAMCYGDPNGVLFMNDGGPFGPWWLSPDIWILGGKGIATVGVQQKVAIIGRKRPGSVPLPLVRIEAFIANAGVRTNPPKPGDEPFTRKIGHVDIPVTDLETAGAYMGVTREIDLEIPLATTNPDDALGAGHRCLIARIYPLGFTPPTSIFTPNVEQHEVWRSILVRPAPIDDQR
jgi:hypothetical protein